MTFAGNGASSASQQVTTTIPYNGKLMSSNREDAITSFGSLVRVKTVSSKNLWCSWFSSILNLNWAIMAKGLGFVSHME